MTEHACGTMVTHKQVCRACVNTPALIETRLGGSDG